MSFSYSIVIDEIDTCGSFNDIHTVSLYNDTITTGKFPTKTLHSHAFPLQLNKSAEMHRVVLVLSRTLTTDIDRSGQAFQPLH